jgi:hypothetical protein
VKAQPCRRVEVEVGMVHPMQPPEPRHRVEHDMLEVDREVQQQHRDDDSHPDRHVDVVEQSPATVLGHDRKADRDDGKRKPQDDRVDHDERKVVRPTDHPRDFSPPAGCRDLPQRHRRQNTQKGGKADRRFGAEDGLRHGCGPLGLWGAMDSLSFKR